MARIVRCGLVQATTPELGTGARPNDLRQALLEKHLATIDEAGKRGVQILAMRELFNAPDFTPTQSPEGFDLAEAVPGPTIEKLSALAKKHGMAMVVPVYEREMAGVYYNTAAVLDADGSYLGKYRKVHLPQAWAGEKYYFRPGNLGFRTFKTQHATLGVLLGYDRHFPEAARVLALRGAEVLVNPSAEASGAAQGLWDVELSATAAANGCFVAAVNRAGTDEGSGASFFGGSCVLDPAGRVIAEAGDGDELLVSELDLEQIEEARRASPFLRDRRPEAYVDLVRETS